MVLDLSREAAKDIALSRTATIRDAVRAVKTTSIFAVRMDEPFIVDTEHGRIAGSAGDWLATNDPAEDPTGDAWPISAERFAASYAVIHPTTGLLEPSEAEIRHERLLEGAGSGTPVPEEAELPSGDARVESL